MVNYLFFIVLLSLKVFAVANEPIIETSLGIESHHEQMPIKVTITITHEEAQEIEPKTFQLDKKPLEASLVQNTSMGGSQNIIVSVYEFELPGQPEGLYILSPVSVEIGGKRYHSSTSSYQVSKGIDKTIDVAGPLIFRLESFFDGPAVLYPGQRTKFIYRISFNRSIDLTESKFPLLNLSHFKKVGDVQVVDQQEKNNLTIQQLTQEMEAAEPGEFTVEPGSIEGYAYQIEKGKKIYTSDLLRSETPSVVVKVEPFPLNGQPSSFAGAIGKVEVVSELISPSKIPAGDNFILKITVKGVQNLSDLRLPLLSCQPGFSGFFQMNDLPPIGDVEGKSKSFLIKLRPIVSLIDVIPSFEIASFDPMTSEYVRTHTNAIPIAVEGKERTIFPLPFSDTLQPSKLVWPTPLMTSLPFQNNPKQSNILLSSSSKIPWKILIGLILILLWGIQWRWKEKIESRKKRMVLPSEELLSHALKMKTPPVKVLNMIETAFLRKLDEENLSHLEQGKEFMHIQKYLYKLRELQYGPDRPFDLEAIKKEGKVLFNFESIYSLSHKEYT